jgi:hypothetical protein
MSQIIIEQLKDVLGINTIIPAKNNKDIIIKSKDRVVAKKALEHYFRTKKIKFKEVFKKSKSTTINVVEVEGSEGDLIFKPLIVQTAARGLSFEKQVAHDLRSWFHGGEDFQHQDVIIELSKSLDLDPNKYKKFHIIHEGQRNTKRHVDFSSNKFILNNSSGKDLSDVTIKSDAGIFYLSLKTSRNFYIVSTSVIEYFSNKSTNSKFCEYFGLDGFRIGSFGNQFMCSTENINMSRVRINLEDVLSQAYGHNVTVVHKRKENDVSIVNVGSNLNASISNLNERSYVYPEEGRRKYANIKCAAKIGTKNYHVDFQFRGISSSDLSPKYLCILLGSV